MILDDYLMFVYYFKFVFNVFFGGGRPTRLFLQSFVCVLIQETLAIVQTCVSGNVVQARQEERGVAGASFQHTSSGMCNRTCVRFVRES